MTWQQRIFTGKILSGIDSWMNRLERSGETIDHIQVTALNSEKVLVLVSYSRKIVSGADMIRG